MKKNIALLLFMFITLGLSAQSVTIYVSPTGLSTGNGTTPQTAVTFTRARTVARNNATRPCTILLTNGTYTTPLSLTSTDTRTAAAPLTIKAETYQGAMIQPLTAVNKTDFKPIPDSIRNRIIDPIAKDKVMQIDLSTYNLGTIATWPNTFGYPVSISTFGSNRQQWPKFFLDGSLMPLSQYPNNGTMTMNGVITKGSSGSKPGGSFKYKDMRTNLWLQAVKEGLWLRGNWRVDWQMDFIKTDSISVKDSIIYQTQGVQLGLGYKYASAKGNLAEPYVAVNLVEEIDMEGEWSFNPTTKIAYMWVPASGNIGISNNATTAGINITNANNIKVENLVISAGAGDGIKLTGSSNCSIAGCEIKNCSGYGVFLQGGTNCMVRSNDIHHVGQGGVFLLSSNFTVDQQNLTPCNHKIINNQIYSYAREVFLYSAAVDSRNAVGSYVANNKIYDCPHVGILFGGNNNVMEYNDISKVVRTYSDMGAFYTSEGWTERGDTIRYNYVHNMDYKGSGLYPDNYASGHAFTYNIAADCYYGSQNNFGYFNRFENNVYYNNSLAHHVNQTGFEPDTNRNCANNLTNLKNIYTTYPTYKAAYPELSDLFGINGTDTTNTAYSSKVWPTLSCNVFLGTALSNQVLKSVADNRAFSTNGTTNATFAVSGDPYVKYRLIFQNNLRIGRKPLVNDSSLLIDTLKRNNVFSRTCGKGWRIGRIGLYADSIYRPSVALTQTAGIKPTFIITQTSKHNYYHGDTITFLVKAINPGIINTFSSMQLFNGASQVNGVVPTLKAAVTDTITYQLVWNGVAAGTYHLNVLLKDSTWWSFSSDTITLTINAPLAAETFVLNGATKNCQHQLTLTTNQAEQGILQYELQKQLPDFTFQTIAVFKPNCMALVSCLYLWTIPLTEDANNRIYRVKMIRYSNSEKYSNAITLTGCKEGDMQFKIVPNPLLATNTFHLQVSNNLTDDQAKIRVYSLLGKLVYTQNAKLHKGNNSIKVNKALKAGNYWVQLTNSNGEVIAKKQMIVY